MRRTSKRGPIVAVSLSLAALVAAWSGCQGAVDGAVTCTGDRFACGDECVPLSRDPGNCGTCGTTCGFGEICRDGMCRRSCASGLLACGAECVDPASDGENCGTCGNDCGGDAHCEASVCVPGPPPGMTGGREAGSGGGRFDPGNRDDPNAPGSLPR